MSYSCTHEIGEENQLLLQIGEKRVKNSSGIDHLQSVENSVVQVLLFSRKLQLYISVKDS